MMQSESQLFNVIHICYDNFIRLPITTDPPADKALYFQSKRYKKDRFSLLWLIQQLIDEIKGNKNVDKFQQSVRSDFPHVAFDIKFTSTKEYFLLLIDDTMHYRSMRKEIRTLARNNEVGLFVTYFASTLEGAMMRNRNRDDSVDEYHLERMSAIIEVPTTDEDGVILHIDVDADQKITCNSVELIALKSIESPLKSVQLIDHPVIEQTVLHKVDLVLRRCVNQKMKSYKQTNRSKDLRELAKILCDKRTFVLREIRMGRIDLPENLEDLNYLID